VIYQDQKVILTSDGTKAGFDGGKITAYSWRVIEAPPGSPFEKSVKAETILSSGISYDTGPVTVAGDYKFTLGVSDGCSTAMAIVCFTVQCNCGPTANGGATSTIWTNTVKEQNDGQSSKGDNVASLTQTYFTLDGSYSYDFNTDDVLTYTWTFSAWEAISPSYKFLPTTNTTATAAVPGYKTVCSGPIATSAPAGRRTDCTFSMVPSAGSAGSVVYDPPDGLAGRAETRNGKDLAPITKLVPGFLETEERFDTPTTSCMANVSRKEVITYNVVTYSQRITNISSSDAVDQRLCQISIFQPTPTNGAGQLPQHNPMARLTVSSLHECRGLFTFKLTVMDKCGASTQSSDEIKVTVRCNAPPVAVAACNETQTWKGFFEQVRIDGRSSYDMDTSVLTYTWSFEENGTPEGYCPPAPATTHLPCTESYCVDTNNKPWVNYVSNPLNPSAGMTFAASKGTKNPRCAPTVYPKIYRGTLPTSVGNAAGSPCVTNADGSVTDDKGTVYANTNCKYDMVPLTNEHVGNSAYFTPTKSGQYLVKLEVYDGCSTVDTRVTVSALCPELRVNAVATPTGRQYIPGGTVSTQLTSTINYQSPDMSMLTYQWSYTAVPQTATLQFTDATKRETVAVASGAGTFTITLQVDDKCQKVTSTAATFTVACSTKPSIPSITQVAPASTGSVLYDGTKFPRVTLRASVQSPASPLTYSWSFNGVPAAQMSNLALSYGTATPGTQNEVQFTPPSVGGVTRYTITVTASDGCSSSDLRTFELNLGCSGSLVAAVETDKISQYDYNTGTFAATSFTGSQTAWPYNGVPGAQKDYSWSVRYFQTPASSGSAVTSGINGAASQTVTIRPQFVGTYQVSLTVNDGCATNTRTTNLIAQCATTAVARIDPANIQVEWNSFASKYSGSFPTVTLDGSKSTGHPSVTLTYNWSPANANQVLVAQQGAVSLNTNKVTFTPSASGTSAFSLTVNNGPCPNSAAATVQVVAVCNVINALIFGSSSFSTSVRWDGTRFPTVCMDGMMSTYRTVSGAETNIDSLAYEWLVKDAPLGSHFEASSTPLVATSAATRNMSYGVNGYLDVRVASNTTDDRIITDRRWEMVEEVRTVTTLAYLNNHHHNRPYTCFKPDKAGQYSIDLTIRDGCTSDTAAILIVASCNAVPQISFTSPSTVQLSGSKFTRVPLTAQVQTASTESLTYNWVLFSAPSGSMLKNGTVIKITNNQDPTASFIPDTAGTYVFNFTADDGCNAAVSRTQTLSVSCNSQMSVGRTYGVPENIDYVGPTAGASNDFGDLSFELTGSVNGNCQVTNTRWVFVDRTCGTHAPVAKPPPVTLPPVERKCSEKITCSWAFDEPCTDTSVNEGYLPPLLEPGQDGQCSRQFRCRHPGVYKVKVTVTDGCTVTESSVDITCRCQTKLSVSAGPDITSFYRCQADEKHNFDEVTLTGQFTNLYSGRNPQLAPDAVQTCPAASAGINCAMHSGCCPKSCCAPPCMPCPRCAACPLCPSQGGSGGGEAALPQQVVGLAKAELAHVVPGAILLPSRPQQLVEADHDQELNAVPASAPAAASVPGAVGGAVPGLTQSEEASVPAAAPVINDVVPGMALAGLEEEQDEDADIRATVLGVILPMSALFLMSAMANIVLIQMIWPSKFSQEDSLK
jgi:hypothetical protein